MFEAHQITGGDIPNISSSNAEPEEKDDDELAVLRGDSRLISQKPTRSPSSSATNSRSSASPAHQTPPPPQEAYTFTPDAHGNVTMPLFGSTQIQGGAPPTDWTSMDIDAILSGADTSDWFSSSVIGSVVDDGSFATLEPEAFPAPVPELSGSGKFPMYSNVPSDGYWSSQPGTDGHSEWLF